MHHDRFVSRYPRAAHLLPVMSWMCRSPLHASALASALASMICSAASSQVFNSLVPFYGAAGGPPEYLVTADDLPHDTMLTNQYDGVSFGGTTLAWDAISFGGGGTAVSPRNVLFNYGTAPMRFTFSVPVRIVGVYNPSVFDAIRLTFRRADNSIIQTIDMPTGAVTFAGYVASENIAAMEAVGIAGLSNFTIFLDNLEFGQGCARISLQPSGSGTCPRGSTIISARTFGLPPRTHRWQVENLPVGSDDWHDLVDGPVPGTTAVASDTGTTMLSLSNVTNAEQRFRLRVGNSCGDAFSAPASVRVCIGDLDCDGDVDDADFVIFAQAYNLLVCDDPQMPAGCPADFDLSSGVDDEDFILFARSYDDLLCP